MDFPYTKPFLLKPMLLTWPLFTTSFTRQLLVTAGSSMSFLISQISELFNLIQQHFSVLEPHEDSGYHTSQHRGRLLLQQEGLIYSRATSGYYIPDMCHIPKPLQQKTQNRLFISQAQTQERSAAIFFSFSAFLSRKNLLMDTLKQGKREWIIKKSLSKDALSSPWKGLASWCYVY